jgi:hypothetical protein
LVSRFGVREINIPGVGGSEHRIRERAPEINGSMFTDRQKLHQHKLVTSDASEELFFRVICPIN